MYNDALPRLPRPNGMLETIHAKLMWLWDPQAAERRWDLRDDEEITFQKRVVIQDFDVILLARQGEDPEHLMVSIASETHEMGRGMRFGADSVHDQNVEKFLNRAGRTGLTLNGAFYPHSRIDRIVQGPVRVVLEGSRGA